MYFHEILNGVAYCRCSYHWHIFLNESNSDDGNMKRITKEEFIVFELMNS